MINFRNIQLEESQLADIVIDLQSKLEVAEIQKTITAEEVEKIAIELDNLFKTTDFTLCITVEFRYFKSNEGIKRALKYMYKKVFNVWCYDYRLLRVV